MPSNVTHRFVSPILWKLIQPLYSSAIQHVFAAAVVYTHRSVPPIPALPTLPVGQRATAICSHLFPNSTASSAAIQKTKRNTSVTFPVWKTLSWRRSTRRRTLYQFLLPNWATTELPRPVSSTRRAEPEYLSMLSNNNPHNNRPPNSSPLNSIPLAPTYPQEIGRASCRERV